MHISRSIQKHIGWLPILFGVFVLIGRVQNIEAFQFSVYGAVVKANAALCFIFLGLSYILFQQRPSKINRFIGIAVALLCFLIALVTICEYSFHSSFVIDEIFIKEAITNINGYPGRMPMLSTVSFLMLSISLLILNFRIKFLMTFSQIFNHLVSLLAFTSLLCFLYGIKLDQIGLNMYSMTLPGTALFFIISIAISSLLPEHGLGKVFYFSPLSKRVAVTFCISITLLIVVIGYLNIYLIKEGLLSYAIASIFTRVLTIVSIIAVILVTANWLNKLEIKQLNAKKLLLSVNKELELASLNVRATQPDKKGIHNDPDLEELELKDLIRKTKRFVKELKSKNELLQDFAHIIAHDLRAPIRNLNSLFEMYQKETNFDVKAEIFDYCELAVRNSLELLDSLIEALMVNSDAKISIEVLYIEDVFTHVLQNLSENIKQKSAIVHADFSQCTTIEYNKQFLVSILQNLLTNAIKYCPENRSPVIFVSTYPYNNSLKLKIADNGIGMDLLKMKHDLFGLFKTFTAQTDSKGIGLYITKKQVEKMGGNISVESEPGVGTTFIVTFAEKTN